MRDRKLGLIALAALIVLDLVLIAIALNPSSGGTSAKAAAASARPTIVSGASASAAGGASESASASPQLVPQALLSVLNADGSLLATKPGACGFGGAETFAQRQTTGSTTAVPVPVQVASAVGALGNGTDYIVGSTAECADFQFYAKEGDGWANGLPLAELFALVPKGNGLVITPNWGVKESTCPAIALTSRDSTDNAFVLCSDGSVLRVTADGLNGVGSVPGARAIATGPGNVLFAATIANGCDGLAVITSQNDGSSWQPVSCITGAATNGPVGIAQRDQSLAVVDAAGKVFRSSDNGVTFISS